MDVGLMLSLSSACMSLSNITHMRTTTFSHAMAAIQYSATQVDNSTDGLHWAWHGFTQDRVIDATPVQWPPVRTSRRLSGLPQAHARSTRDVRTLQFGSSVLVINAKPPGTVVQVPLTSAVSAGRADL